MLFTMIKGCGMILVVICTTWLGVVFARTLSDRVSELETAIAVLDGMQSAFSYRMMPPDEAIFELECRDSLAQAAYLPACASLCRQGIPFPQAWKRAVFENPKNLHSKDQEILASLGDTIGQLDLQAQLSQIMNARGQLILQEKQARMDCESRAQLYRSMGLLAGAFVVIVFI